MLCDVGLQSSGTGEEPGHLVEQMPALGTDGSEEVTIRKISLTESSDSILLAATFTFRYICY